MSSPDARKRADFQLDKWRDVHGDEVAERTQFLGHDSSQYRINVNLPPVHRDLQNKHNVFIHELGADVLRAKLDEEKQMEMEREALLKKQTKVTKLLRRKIKVTDLEDGGVSISMDQEWDTSTWNEELIQAGCEALILIFYDANGTSSVERKERAVQMLQKLLYRHTSAELYVRKNIEMMIGKAANKSIRGGKCGGLLDLLYILHSCKESFLKEMSQANFNGRAIDMLMQEARLAAIIIQHAFRAQRNAKQLYKGGSTLVKHVGFGTAKDITQSRLGVVSARSHELRTKWCSMHAFHPHSVVTQIGGIRGPIHIGSTYTLLVLDIIHTLVHANALNLAHGNREDVVRASGCVLLTTYLGCASGVFSRLAAAILANLSEVWESFLPVITSGCIGSAVKSMHYLRTVLQVGTENQVYSKHDKVTPLQAYLYCVDTVTNTAAHAAGMYRACMGYRTLVPPHHAVESINYTHVLNVLQAQNYNKTRIMDEIKLYFGNVKLLRELGSMVLYTNIPEILIRVLKCIFTILCTEAHDMCVVEITALQGTLMIRLAQLIHHINIEVGTLALCIFMQICCEHRSRQQLTRVVIQKQLYNIPTLYNISKTNASSSGAGSTSGGMLYTHPGLHRSVLMCVVLCRQFNWRYYEPEVFYKILLGVLPFNYNATTNSGMGVSTSGGTSSTGGVYDANAVRHMLLLDLLRTMRTDNNISDEMAEQNTISDWVVLTNNEPICYNMSTSAITYNVKCIVDFIVHPNEPNYYESLPLHESSAICVILENINANTDTAVMSYSVGCINFISKYLYLCKYLFLGKRMLNSQILILLNGIKSGVMALGRYAKACMVHCMNSAESSSGGSHIRGKKDSNNTNTTTYTTYNTAMADSYITLIRSTECITTILYFMNTLSIQHPKLEHTTRALQVVVGIGCIDFLNMYAEMVIFVNKKSSVARLQDLHEPAKMVVNLIQYLKTIHKKSEHVVNIFRRACHYLHPVTLTTEGCTVCIQEYNIFTSLRIFLPSPLSGILPLEERECNILQHTASLDSLSESQATALAQRRALLKSYKVSLLQLPVSFFLLCANLCRVDEGLAMCFSEGYVRRTLDRLNILNSKFIKNCTMYAKNKQHTDYTTFCDDLCGCLQFVTNCANYHHPRYGSVNDLIFHELYEYIPLCKNVIVWQLYTKTPRTDNIVVCAYNALAAVAKDSYRVSLLFEKYDIFKIIRDELIMLDTLPVEAAKSAVLCIERSVHGITSQYIVDYIAQLREPLFRVTRIYLSLGAFVRDCNWTLTRSAMLYKDTINPNYTVDQEIDIAVQDFVRTGTTHAHRRASDMIRRASVMTNISGNSSNVSAYTNTNSALNSTLNSTHNSVLGSVQGNNEFSLALRFVRKQNEQHMYSGTHTPLVLPSIQDGDEYIDNTYTIHTTNTRANNTLSRGNTQSKLDIINSPVVKQVSTPSKIISNLYGTPTKSMSSTDHIAPYIDSYTDTSNSANYAANNITTNKNNTNNSTTNNTSTNNTTTNNDNTNTDLNYTVAYTPPGTYLHCGVTSCGSLLVPCTHQYHGYNTTLTSTQREQQILKLPFHDINDVNLCSVSKLSARGNGLQKRMQDVKMKSGFRDIKRSSSSGGVGGVIGSGGMNTLQSDYDVTTSIPTSPPNTRNFSGTNSAANSRDVSPTIHKKSVLSIDVPFTKHPASSGNGYSMSGYGSGGTSANNSPFMKFDSPLKKGMSAVNNVPFGRMNSTSSMGSIGGMGGVGGVSGVGVGGVGGEYDKNTLDTMSNTNANAVTTNKLVRNSSVNSMRSLNNTNNNTNNNTTNNTNFNTPTKSKSTNNNPFSANNSNTNSNNNSSANLRSLASPAPAAVADKIREISLSDMPELILTRPPK